MGEFYEGDQKAIIVWIPKNACALEVTAKIIEDDKIQDMTMNMDADGIFQARQDYLLLDPYDDAFDTYRLTEKGKELMEYLENLDN